ncbi:MAG: hypothetical protein LC768_11080 [Acidobacteria bacterium]|nr:hypothetical protein [Acidobacteriota bacterium]
MKIFSPFFFASIALNLVFPSDALACACCADAGTYSIRVKNPDKYEFDELKKIKFTKAKLFTTPGYPDDIKGINPLGENYSLNGSLQNNLWKLDLTDDKDKSGTLNLTKPSSMVVFMADLHDSKDTGAGVKLYKEWRFKYGVNSGTGIFQKGIAPKTEYFLVLQGRGNACTTAGDFTHWRLEITGKKASYAFFGELNSTNNDAN